VIVPIWSSDEQRRQILEYVGEVRAVLDGHIAYHVDDRDQFKPG